jgi:hypothetical protein
MSKLAARSACTSGWSPAAKIDANLVDLSVKESVLQFNPQGKVEVEG